MPPSYPLLIQGRWQPCPDLLDLANRTHLQVKDVTESYAMMRVALQRLVRHLAYRWLSVDERDWGWCEIPDHRQTRYIHNPHLTWVLLQYLPSFERRS